MDLTSATTQELADELGKRCPKPGMTPVFIEQLRAQDAVKTLRMAAYLECDPAAQSVAITAILIRYEEIADICGGAR